MLWRTQRSRHALAAFAGIALLLAAGLGWVTHQALATERQQALAQAEADFQSRLRLAMWRLDGVVAPVLARESARPPEHYYTLSLPALALRPDGQSHRRGEILQPSPILNAVLPDWVRLHFHVCAQTGWRSPQVVRDASNPLLRRAGLRAAELARHTQELTVLARDLPATRVVGEFATRDRVPTRWQWFLVRGDEPPAADATPPIDSIPADASSGNPAQAVAASNPANPTRTDNPRWVQNTARDRDLRQSQQLYSQNLLQQPSVEIGLAAREVQLFLCPDETQRVACSAAGECCDPAGTAAAIVGPMIPTWLVGESGARYLAFVRRVAYRAETVLQGVLLDWPRLRAVLESQDVVRDLFPRGTLEPDIEPVVPRPPTAMTTLPVTLQIGQQPAASIAGWTTLRVVLGLAWLALAAALTGVAWGGWALLEHAERRSQFVSAVTHELRTPLTTLRLYLDMLSSGMVRDDNQRAEYLRTLAAESDRLAGLVDHVLAYSQVEDGQPAIHVRPVLVGDLLREVRSAAEPRCAVAGKTLVVEDGTPPGTRLASDAELLGQVLCNLIDNACKHTAGAADSRVWLRSRQGSDAAVFEVEDRGPGIAAPQRESIFRPFYRATTVEPAPPGLGLGLALARRWAGLLGGSLELEAVQSGSTGARFSLRIPCSTKGLA
jgi:signal transduction histidine kinase